MIIKWNSDKAHRCPRCHAVAVDEPSKWKVYTCCTCGSGFARWPRLQRLLPHAGVACGPCTERHLAPVDGEPFGFLRSRHAGVGAGAQLLTEAWLFDADDIPAHRDGVRYLNTRSSRSEAMADIAGWRTFYRREQEDRSPVFGVVLDERREKYGPTVPRELQDHFLDGTLDFYGVGLLRPHPRHGRFHADALTFTWGIVAPCGLEGIYTQVDRVPKSLADYAPRSP